MTMEHGSGDALQLALDAALARALGTPGPSAAFRERLQAQIARSNAADTPAQRERFERELQEQLVELRRGYIRLQRRTLAWMLGGAFAAGAAAMVALPWLQSHFGPGAGIAVPITGAVIGLAICAAQVAGRVESLRP